MRYRWLPAAALLTITGCAGPGQRVGAGDLLDAMVDGTAPLVLDVRSASEYRAGHVPGAVHLPFHSTWSRPPAASTGQPILVYCDHGPRAALARFGLQSLGYERVLSLDGHMARWRADGHPVTTGPEP